MTSRDSLPKFGLAAYGATAVILGIVGFVWRDFAVNLRERERPDDSLLLVTTRPR